MSSTLEVVDTKLDILIEDFQEFKRTQSLFNRDLHKHATDEDKVQASILSTQRWHTAIGSSVLTIMAVVILHVYSRLETIDLHHATEEAAGLYYDVNRPYIIEIIEEYKKGHPQHD